MAAFSLMRSEPPIKIGVSTCCIVLLCASGPVQMPLVGSHCSAGSLPVPPQGTDLPCACASQPEPCSGEMASHDAPAGCTDRALCLPGIHALPSAQRRLQKTRMRKLQGCFRLIPKPWTLPRPKASGECLPAVCLSI